MNFGTYTLSGYRAAVPLALLAVLLSIGKGSARPFPLTDAARLLDVVSTYPGSVRTSQSDPRPLVTNYDSGSAVTATSEYVVSATVAHIEEWYVQEFKTIGWAETGHGTSFNGRTGVTTNYEVEFTSLHYPLVYYQVGLKPLAKNKTLIYVLVADSFTPRPASSYLSPSFDGAKVTIYTVTTSMVREKVTMYPFLLKKVKKNDFRSFTVTNTSVVRNWVVMLNAMPVAPKIGAKACGDIGPDTKTAQVVFTASNSSLRKTVTLDIACGTLPSVGSVTLWDATGKFWHAISSYP